MKNWLLYISILCFVAGTIGSYCSPEKEIQVQQHTWRLIDKKPASRFVDDEQQEYVWLSWEEVSRQVVRKEKVTKQVADSCWIGMIVLNRDER